LKRKDYIGNLLLELLFFIFNVKQSCCDTTQAAPSCTLFANKRTPLLLVLCMFAEQFCPVSPFFVLRTAFFGYLEENVIPKAPHWCSL